MARGSELPVTYLDRILESHREAAQADRRTLDVLTSAVGDLPSTRGFRDALRTETEAVAVIAEIKRRSPSKGDLFADLDASAVAVQYAEGGATCLSVLTDETWFGGSVADLQSARDAVGLPVLRKDFTVDARDVVDARLMGADCVLLIAECLTDQELQNLHDVAGRLGMQTLIELYDAENLDRVLQTGTRMIGINNRDLRTFATSLDHTFSLLSKIPDDVLLVSESGIRTHADILRLAAAGVGGVLVGESLMRQQDIELAVRQLMRGD